MATLRWKEVHHFLHETEQQLLSALTQARPVLHRPAAEGGWSPAQVVDHLVRTEKLLNLIWTLVPRLRAYPRVLKAADRANSGFWLMLGLRTIESPREKLTPANATMGRFQAPHLLRPPKRAREFDQLIAWRSETRAGTVQRLSALDEGVLNSLRWTHPLLGSFTLLEFAQFLGTHELHHLPQIQRSRE